MKDKNTLKMNTSEMNKQNINDIIQKSLEPSREDERDEHTPAS